MVVRDANLHHEVPDPESLDLIKQTCDYQIAPAGTDADEMVLHLVEQKGCILISNDKYAEWRNHSEWLASNIDRIMFGVRVENSVAVLDDAIEELKALT